MSPSRHPWITVAVVAVAGAGAAVLALVLVYVLVIVPLVQAVDQAPAQIAHAYSDYWNSVGQEIQQAQQQNGGTP